MIEIRCKCGCRFEVPDEARGLTTDCPECGRITVVGEGNEAALLGKPPEDGTKGPGVREYARSLDQAEEFEPVAPGNAKPFDLARQVENVEPPRSDEDHRRFNRAMSGEIALDETTDTIIQPKTTFARDVLRSFRVLFAGTNRHMAIVMAAMDLILWLSLLSAVLGLRVVKAGQGLATVGGALLLLGGASLWTIPMMWTCAVFFRTCQAGCVGDDREKLVAIHDGVWDDLIVPFARFVATWVAVLSPLLLLWTVARTSGAFAVPWPVAAALAAAGVFAWPAAVLNVALGETVRALTPGNILRIVALAPRTYLAVWVALSAFAAVACLGGWTAWEMITGRIDGGILVYVLLMLISAAGLVIMRIVGLMYRHFKARLPVDAE